MSKIESFLQILSSYNINPGATTILDIGFGNGKFTLELGKIFKKVVAIDKSAARCNERRKGADGHSTCTEKHLKVAARLRDTAWLSGCVHTTYGPPFSAALKSIVLP